MKPTTKPTSKKTLISQIWLGLRWGYEKVYREMVLFNCWRRYRIRESHKRKHTYIVGASGSGKTELMKKLIWWHIIYGKTAIVVLDPNGDLAEQVAKFKDNLIPFRKKDMVYVQPDLSDDLVPVINPLDLPNLSRETLDKVVQQTHKTLCQSLKEHDVWGKWLSPAMSGMLYNMLHTLFRKKGSSLLELIRFVDDEQNADLVALGMDTNNYIIQDYFKHKFMNPWLRMTKSRLGDRLSALLNKTSLQRLLTGKTTIDLKKMINQKKLIIFNLSKGKMGEETSKIYGRFVLTTILNIMLARADIPPEFRVPCHFYVDEFHNYVVSDRKLISN